LKHVKSCEEKQYKPKVVGRNDLRRIASKVDLIVIDVFPRWTNSMAQSESYITSQLRKHLKLFNGAKKVPRIVVKVYGFRLVKTEHTLTKEMVPNRIFKMPVVGYSNFEAWAEYDPNNKRIMTRKEYAAFVSCVS